MRMTLDKTRFRDAPVVAVSAKPSSSTDDLPEGETGISRSGHQLKFLFPFCVKNPLVGLFSSVPPSNSLVSILAL